jgi:hypothetical protein
MTFEYQYHKTNVIAHDSIQYNELTNNVNQKYHSDLLWKSTS